MAFTFSDALTWASYLDNQATSTRDIEMRKRVVNDANRAMHGYDGRLLDCDRMFIQYSLTAAYMPATTTATVAATIGSSTLTGSAGAAFTSSMVGWYARIAGAFEQYVVSAYSSATSITIQPYLGSTAGYQGTSGNQLTASIAITQNRVLLPANFRSIDNAQIDYAYGYLDGSKTRDEISYMNMYLREVNQPRCFATETDKNLTDSTQREYLLIYPPASSARILRTFIYCWPNYCTSNTDEFGINGYALPTELEPVLRMFIEAYIAKNRNNPQWESLLAKANQAVDASQSDRSNSYPKQRSQWTPEGDTNSNASYAYPFGNVLNQASQ